MIVHSKEHLEWLRQYEELLRTEAELSHEHWRALQTKLTQINIKIHEIEKQLQLSVSGPEGTGM